MVLHTQILNEKNMEFAMLSRLFYTRTVHRKPSSKATLKCSLLVDVTPRRCASRHGERERGGRVRAHEVRGRGASCAAARPRPSAAGECTRAPWLCSHPAAAQGVSACFRRASSFVAFLLP